MPQLRSYTLAALTALALTGIHPGASAELASVPAQTSTRLGSTGFDGTVEAVRQTTIAAQVAGAIVQLDARAGDKVKAGQILLRIDARAAEQSAVASEAQVQAGHAALDVARKEFARQQQLFQSQFISQAALDRAEAEFKSTQAQVNVQLAQAGAARTQSGLHLVRAPYDGVVAEVPVALGDMALPGRPLVTVYDPAALRVTAAVPQSVAAQLTPAQLPRIELAGLPPSSQWLTPTRMQQLPTVDAATHTVQLRAELPADASGAVPGMFARLWLPVAAAGASGALTVPTQALVRRAEMVGLYVLDAAGRPLLRQVRVGRTVGENVEILSGLTAGERVVTDPAAAARVR